MLKVLKNIYLGLLVLIAAFPILPFAIRSIVTILILLVAISNASYSPEKKPWKILVLFALPIICLGLSLLYTNDFSAGMRDLTQLLSFIAIPLAFFLYPVSSQNKRLLSFVFIGSVLVLIAYQSIKIGYNHEELFAKPTAYELKINGFKNYTEASASELQAIKTRRLRSFCNDITQSHPTYQAIWTVFAIALLVFYRKSLRGKFLKFFGLLAILILLGWLLMLSSRMPIIAGVIATIVFGVKKSITSKLAVASAFALIGIMVYLSVPNINNRVNEIFESSKNIINPDSTVKDFSSTNVRFGIYSCVFDLHQNKPIIGYGIGGVQDTLTECLTTKINSRVYNWKTYNTHNQYFYILLATGYLGFAVFLLWIFYFFKIAIKKKYRIFSFFFLFTLLCLITENVWARNDGILFFGFFSGLFLFNTIRNSHE